MAAGVVMNRADVVTSTRMAGRVKRYHTWPTIQTQTVAEHSWQVMRLFRQIFPDAWCVEVAEYILWHDAPEIGTGDIPFPVKANYPELKEIMDDIEGEVAESLGIVWPELTPRQRGLIKICDLVEMYQFGSDEVLMGNQFAQPIVGNTRSAAWELAGQHSVQPEIAPWIRVPHP